MIKNNINNHTLTYNISKEYNKTHRDSIHNPIIML